MIVLPTITHHLIDAVLCATESSVIVQAKSGRHSYASFSSGGQNGAMVIDLESFQQITVGARDVAQIGGGVRLGDMALGIFNQSQRALPHGTCLGVGIGGHASYGGFGLDSRMWGITMDTIEGLDVVLANGSFIHATSTAYPDIYYALRGAADSFGIITTFYLQTLAAPASVVNWQYSIPGRFVSAATATAVFTHIQAFARNASVLHRKLGLGVYLDGSGFSVSGTYIGNLTTFNTEVAPELLRGLPTPSSSSIRSVDWIESLTLLASSQPLQHATSRTSYTLHDDFFAKSIGVLSSAPLIAATLTSYFTYIIQNGVNAPDPWFSIRNLYGGPDSQIIVPSPSSAYSDCSALWMLQHYGYTGNTGSPYLPASLTFVNGLNAAITNVMSSTTFVGYLNYVDPSLTTAQAHTLYYGSTTYAKLLSTKHVVDPGKVFSNPQFIGN